VIKVCQLLVAGWWFSPGTSVSTTNKTDCHDILEILLKVGLTIQTLTQILTPYDQFPDFLTPCYFEV
jgi:hypothetical protein